MAEKCRSCGAAVRWVLTSTGKRMPLDLDPQENGNITLDESGMASVGKTGEGPRYVSHFASCPQAKNWRRARGE